MPEVPFDSWRRFRSKTFARIALGRAGASLPTREVLSFGVAHAMARDAVSVAIDFASVSKTLNEQGLETLLLESRVSDRSEYLRRPDLGRRLSDTSRQRLQEIPTSKPADLVIAVSDGLSALASSHGVELVTKLQPRLKSNGWCMAPIMLVRFGRVAIQDEIGELVGASLSLILLGERPGLGSPDSLGAYFVYGPRAGRTDAERNCVSNIRPEGLSPELASETLYFLLTQSRTRKLSGVSLKDDRQLPMKEELRSISGSKVIESGQSDFL